MRNSASQLRPDYSRRLVRLDIERAPSGECVSSHPVTVRLERIDPPHEGHIETVKARYVAGSDGARSTVRQSLGLALQGDSANQAWGVMDILVVTDFPDIRLKSLIQSAHEGSIVLIPREGGYLVRIYVELDKLSAAISAPSACSTRSLGEGSEGPRKALERLITLNAHSASTVAGGCLRKQPSAARERSGRGWCYRNSAN